jgi:hypothetical protein
MMRLWSRVRLGWKAARASSHSATPVGGIQAGHAEIIDFVADGVMDAVAIKLMGHADSKILRRYQEVVDELQRDAATKMDALLGGAEKR